MSYVKLNLENAYKFVSSEQIEALKSEVVEAANVLVSQSGAGNDFLGWLNLPLDYDKEEFDRILAAAEKIKAQADVLVVIGIGGSYLGAKSAIAGSVVVPDLLITLIANSLSFKYSINSLTYVPEI